MGDRKKNILKFRNILFLFSFFSFGQTFKGKVVDVINNPISKS